MDRVAARNTGLEDCGIEYSVKDLPAAGLELMTSVKLHETFPYANNYRTGLVQVKKMRVCYPECIVAVHWCTFKDKLACNQIFLSCLGRISRSRLPV